MKKLTSQNNPSLLTEEQIIQIAQKAIGKTSEKVIKGIGDDTAVLKPVTGFELFTADILIEGTHFLLDKISPYDLGWKSLAVNISDIASMGGIPAYAVISIGLNNNTNAEWLESFYQGLADCAGQVPMDIVGGDTVSSKNSVVISIAVTGSTERPVYRNTVKDGDVLVTTGELGASGLGLWLLQNRNSYSKEEEYLIKKHTKPPVRVKEGIFLNSKVKNLSMLDCSDGLYTSCKLFCEQSEKGITLFAEKFPLSEHFKSTCKKYLPEKDRNDFVLYGGEDYELIAAMPETEYEELKQEYLKIFGSELTLLGKFNNKVNKITLEDKNLNIILNDKSFKHF